MNLIADVMWVTVQIYTTLGIPWTSRRLGIHQEKGLSKEVNPIKIQTSESYDTI